jgi:AhpD family alkylhydroperoxidase
MKTLVSATAMFVTFVTCAIALRADTQPPADDPYKQIKQTLGFVPGFIKAMPDEAVAAAFDEMSAIELSPDTALPGKTKELIGLAVAAQVPCRYCVYAHTQFAKVNGANDRELREAVAIAAITRHWSTVLNGMQIDEQTFAKEMKQVFSSPHKQPDGTPVPVTDADSAYKDIERTLGMVPTFLRAFPQSGIAAAWREMKSVQMNSATALDGKTKELIGLGVAAQIPCKYCIVFHTMAARGHGATDQEVSEAVAMAAVTRHWSTIANGTMQDEAQFRRDIDQIVKNARRDAKTPKHAER